MRQGRKVGTGSVGVERIRCLGIDNLEGSLDGGSEPVRRVAVLTHSKSEPTGVQNRVVGRGHRVGWVAEEGPAEAEQAASRVGHLVCPIGKASTDRDTVGYLAEM